MPGDTDGSGQIRGRDEQVGHVAAVASGGAVDVAATDAAAGQQRRERMRPMVAKVLRVAALRERPSFGVRPNSPTATTSEWSQQTPVAQVLEKTGNARSKMDRGSFQLGEVS